MDFLNFFTVFEWIALSMLLLIWCAANDIKNFKDALTLLFFLNPFNWKYIGYHYFRVTVKLYVYRNEVLYQGSSKEQNRKAGKQRIKMPVFKFEKGLNIAVKGSFVTQEEVTQVAKKLYPWCEHAEIAVVQELSRKKYLFWKFSEKENKKTQEPEKQQETLKYSGKPKEAKQPLQVVK